ncbi:MAG: glycoside hydrolase family 28 protein [Prevotella sp.]|nr:glycoside hydrolase family 28 protein [Prevotella sp.]MBR7049630.1 glycoside hydrolase family 28 protein [Prevotella sp.]
MTKLIITLLCALFSLSVNAKGKWKDYKKIEKRIVAPIFPDREILITDFGATVYGKADDNQKAINNAILACSEAGGGRVVVPKGKWITGGIRLQSNVNLVVSEGATLLFAFDTRLYPLVKTRWEGVDCWNYQPLIYAYECENIAITGKGTIDGNGSQDTWWGMTGYEGWGWKEGMETQRFGVRDTLLKQCNDNVPVDKRRYGMGYGLRPQLINLYLCKNVLVEGVTLLRSPFWVLHPLMCKNLTVRNVKVWNEGPNGDGCDPESCTDVLIEGCTFHTGDDCIAIKAGRNVDGRKPECLSENIIVRNCKMEDGHGGVVLGSEISGGARNVFVHDCQMDSEHLDRVIRIKTNSCRGGIIENVFVRDITVGKCGECVLKINLNYDPKEVFGRGHNPIVRNIHLDRITCNSSQYGIFIIGLEEVQNVYDIHFRNSRLNGVSKQPMRIEGMVAPTDVKGLVINGTKVK